MQLRAISYLSLVVSAIASSSPAVGQDALTSVLRSSTKTVPYFAAFDVRGEKLNRRLVEEEVAAAFRKHYDSIRVRQGMPSHPLPSGAPRMTFSVQNTSMGAMTVPDCAGASSVVTGNDASMAKYGEVSILQACIFPYQAGLRVNLFANFMQKSGGDSPNVLGAMVGRLFTNAIGLGDSSRFIVETIDDVEQRLLTLAPQVALVEMEPPREGKEVVTDPAGQSTSTPQVAMAPPTEGAVPQAVNASVAPAQIVGTPGGMPPQIMELQQKMLEALQRQQAVGLNPPGGAQLQPVQPVNESAALQARRELNSIGLAFHDQDQFVDAVRRDDMITARLFLTGRGVGVNTSNKSGVAAMQVAKSPEMKERLASFEGR